jgi:N-methylhydantoinase B
VISVQSCGGGGFGPAEQRDPEAVLVDVRDGKVSVERAREIYRVVIDAERWTIDVASTERLRAESSSGQ